MNNAGFPIKDELWDKPLHEPSEEDVKEALDVDTLGSFRRCKEVLPVMMKQKHCVMINISSTPVVVDYDKGAPYTLGKSAVLGLTKHIAKEYGKYGIRCNAIAPGPNYAEKLGKVIQSRKTEHGLRHIPWQAW